MTTNHPEKLDEALIRPGRVDYVSEFKLASKIQAKKMFLKFYPKEKDLAEEIYDKMEDNKLSMAQLQGHFMTWKDDPLKATQTFSELKDQTKQFQENEENGSSSGNSNHITPISDEKGKQTSDNNTSSSNSSHSNATENHHMNGNGNGTAKIGDKDTSNKNDS